jgi:GH15 family glucan-1,4-alpha-glucosidase
MNDPIVSGCLMERLDHGITGNGRLLALISPTSSIDWFCAPRFDSPSLFGRILDEEKGGTFRFLHNGRELPGQMRYIKNTNVLITRFVSDAETWEVVDFFPRIPEGLGVRLPKELIRIIRPLSGRPNVSVDFDPRPDYARGEVLMEKNTDSIRVQSIHGDMHLYSNLSLSYIGEKKEFVIDRPYFFILSHHTRENPTPQLPEVQGLLDTTILGWRAWAKSCALPTFAPEAALRSALCLKLHIYEDTGAILAAATTSIPEAIGSGRTWDYRYCWMRDAAFVIEALRRIGQLGEGENFLNFLFNVTLGKKLQPLYSISGETDLREEMLHHLRGFDGNNHVRIGNAAYQQRQNDLMGEMILCIETILTDPRVVHHDPGSYFPLIERLVEGAIEAAPTADTGIWEYRTMMHEHTFSRAMCWVAIHRGAGLARRLGREEHAARWEGIAEREREIVLARGYNAERGCFTQILDGEYPDASLLLLPTIGIIDANDPRFISTVETYERLLVNRGLMFRYKNIDDLGETTSAFTICSFWWCEALALMGRLDDAVRLFERLLRYANPLGLFSEDIDPVSGRLLGNFPQGYAHVGLIHAAMTIGELMEARDGRCRAWT